MSTRRKIEKNKDSQAQQDLEEKTMIYEFLPENCVLCHKNFDKTDRSMLKTWYVTVREQMKLVMLYCPECWEKMKNAGKNISRQDIAKSLEENSPE